MTIMGGIMDRALWIHLVSAHADPLAVLRDGQDNKGEHEYQHRGPGKVRHLHPVSDMSFNLDTAKAVLSEYVTDLSV